MPTPPPPAPAPYDDDATTQQLVRAGAWMVAVTGTLIALLLLRDDPVSWTHVLLNLGAGAMGAVAVLLGRLRRWHQAALVLVWGVWSVVAVVAATNGGLRGPNLLNFPVLIVFSGWILGARSTLWLTGATGLLFLLFVWADLHGWLPAARYGNRAAYVAYLGGILGVTAAATLLSRRSYLRRVREAERTAAEIQRLAHLDTLTSLPNRAALVERLSALRGAEPHQHALMLLDLDRFTTFNDARGSEMGDRLLCAVAQRLSGLLPPQGLLVRVAGDEFAVVLGGLGADAVLAGRHAFAFSGKLQALLRHPLHLGGDAGDVQLGASIGITLYPQCAGDGAQDALRRAGTALHRAKQAGGGGVAFFEQGMGQAAEQRFRVERELRHAIRAGELRLYLQPQVDVRGRFTGAEVLVRWQHPRDGLVAPGLFIPIAEESDLIVDLGGWVLEHACALLARPEFTRRRLRLSVNLSARQFRQAGFVEQLRALLAIAGADPSLLTLEVTEGLVIDDFDDAVAKMRELAALGVEISLDDFGTGYSSLAYLKRLPIHEIKIDRSFVHEAPTNADDGVLVEGILSVARHFGLRVVAEGVETRAQAAFLSQRAPDIVYQGYLFGRPEPHADWLARLDDDDELVDENGR